MNSKKNLKRNLLICLLAGSAVMYTLPLHAATSVIGNNTLPTGENSLTHNHTFDRGNLEMTITQSGSNGIIKWDSFDVGGSATVNFRGDAGGYNVLNYVNGANASQIYGTINANNNGNIFIVNPAGVQIGNSAQINVGSLYVSNQNLDTVDWSSISANTDVNTFLNQYDTHTNAELMSLGNINITNVKNGNVTFEGNGRIVIDTERIKKNDVVTDNFIVKTDDVNDVLLGYDAYNTGAKKDTYAGKDKTFNDNVLVNGQKPTEDVKGYMWVEDVNQLQAIDTNLDGNYALRNSIDATGTEQKYFTSIGSDNNAFKGKFDGIDYNIFGLNIKETGNNVGLFGYTDGATINNVTLVGGSVSGKGDVGAIVGYANNTTISNAVNSASVTGEAEVGGIVGTAINSTITNAVNTGKIESVGKTLQDGSTLSNVGGLVGYMSASTLDGNSYNLGDVSGKGYNVGGLVGSASNSTIGNPSVVNGKPVENVETVYNRMDVTGAYNVGGIVGNMEGTTVQNAENSGTVSATGHTTENYIYHSDYTVDGHNKHNYEGKDDNNGHYAVATVNVANVGGIAGTSSKSSIENVTNSGDVSSSVSKDNTNIFEGGNVGGVVGRAENTNITTATNRENEIRGAHNVGGVAGYFGSTKGDSTDKDTPHYTVTNGINDGGDIMATGARNGSGFVKEIVRKENINNKVAPEEFTVGNIGGIVGYMYGDGVKVTGSANRGTVHTDEPDNPAKVEEWQKAANVGGIVGKIDSDKPITGKGNLDKIYENAAVSNSYNTGDVLGYTGIGGIAGMMYNGAIAGSYNLGDIRTTRQSDTSDHGDKSPIIDPINMGGIVGDTTEQSSASVYLYDVYNKGKIGDETYTYFGRHVGGIVGRLSGTVEKAYNTGAIYNGYNVVGGIAGWMVKGSIKNSFNTGNITVNDKNNNANSEVGGIVGAADISAGDIHIDNVYNLGTVRSFKIGKGENEVGGIIGGLHKFYFMNSAENKNHVYINNAYTTGNLYAHNGEVYSIWVSGSDDSGANAGANRYITTNTYYIKPEKGLGFNTLVSSKDGGSDNSNKPIEFADKSDIGKYQYDENGKHYSLTFTQQVDGDVDGGGSVIAVTENGKATTEKVEETGDWRIYAGNTPILNAFLPDAEGYFSQKGNMAGIGSIQYGTAYDPLLTIINAANDTNQLKYEWDKLGISNAAGLVVYGAGLTLDNVNTSGGSGYFGGTIYADGALNLNGGKNDIGLGSAADIYGSAVNITTDGKVTIYGDVTATGNTANGATSDTLDKINVDGAGNININACDVDVYGTLTSAEQGSSVVVSGIEDQAVQGWKPGLDIGDEEEVMSDIADRFAHTTGASDVDGNITIIAKTKLVVDDNDEPILDENGNKQYIGGNVNLYYGNKEQGLITTGGDLTVTGTGDVYVDSDLSIGGGLSLTAGADKEIVLDISNIGQVQNNHNNTDAVKTLHKFLAHFNNTDYAINFSGTDDAKITVDMWQGDSFDLNKFNDNTGKTFGEAIAGVKVNVEENKNISSGRDITHIWVSSGEQLKNIQTYYNEHINDTGILGYNFALKNDINASDVSGYEAIGTNSANGFTGTFDGRGNRIIRLKVENANGNAGIFDTIGTNGVVKDVNIYSGTFTGSENAGAVAGVNKGRIEGIVTFGNTVTVTGKDGKAGGIVGVNNSGKFTDDKNDGELTNGIYDVESTGSVIAGSSSAIAGGLVGTNNGGLANSFSDSAVTVGINVTGGTSAGLGGVVGVNTEKGNVQYVDSLGVTNGGATNSSNIGGIIGINNGNMYSGYNESIVSGKDKVGGIIGENSTGGTVTNIVNATSVTGENVSADNVSQYVGGLVGSNSGSVTNGRNNGTITGTNYVGGMVGSNAQGATLTNLVNDSSAAIEGENYVGGIAGTNAGTITAQNQSNLINRGSITGQNYVGGVAGENIGTIEYVKNDVNLYVKDDTKTAQYFGGVAGINGRVDDETTTDVNEAVTGTITSATNEGDVVAENAQYVGGIVGWNTSQGKLVGMGNSNEGTVIGGSYVGGVIGKNDAAIGSKGSAQVGITNEGTVIATKGGAGGLIGENNAAITNTVMINRGEVHGNNTNDGSGTGGLIGTNNENGDITYSSLINEATGTVTGTNNVGGLIGVNKADITGGRDTVEDEDAGMYINKIYNNGVINVGTYKDENGDGKYVFDEQDGNNIGGLIGDNQGSLTAGYNTGAINASGSTNVGGIAGSNAGTVDQVFNTVMTENGQNQTITGGTNVGGLVGDNTGTITNAYNTSNVVATNQDCIVGNLVGTNTGEVKFVYGVANNLIGSGTGSIKNYYVIDGSDKWLQEGTYEDFPVGANGWKIYDGSTLPMLSVFLTKVTVVDQHLVNQYFSAKHYGELHQITADDIKALIAIGAISAPDGFGAFNNNNGLIQGVADDAMANSGNWLYSGQIADSFVNGIFNPNNLGYDISLVYSPFENEDWPNNHWNYLFNDAPFDRNKDFRERKAEVNFVDGGMEI